MPDIENKTTSENKVEYKVYVNTSKKPLYVRETPDDRGLMRAFVRQGEVVHIYGFAPGIIYAVPPEISKERENVWGRVSEPGRPERWVRISSTYGTFDYLEEDTSNIAQFPPVDSRTLKYNDIVGIKPGSVNAYGQKIAKELCLPNCYHVVYMLDSSRRLTLLGHRVKNGINQWIPTKTLVMVKQYDPYARYNNENADGMYAKARAKAEEDPFRGK